MKLEIELSQDKADELTKLATEWKELSPYPLSNVERLQNLEKEISKKLTQVILATNALNTLLSK